MIREGIITFGKITEDAGMERYAAVKLAAVQFSLGLGPF